MNARVLFAVAVLSFVAPALAAGQGTGTRFSVQGTLGPQINGGGDSQSVSFGFAPVQRLEFLVSGERIHLPTEVTRFEGGFSATRGGTTRFISGEARFVPFPSSRVSPYVLAGAGRGTSRPNVNDIFPDPVSNSAGLLFAGGGVRVSVVGGLSLVADIRYVLQTEDNGDGSVYAFVPLRGGLAWRF